MSIPLPASFTWTIDLTAPDTTLTAMPASPTNSTSASFTFSASEAGSTFACQLDGGGFAACTSPQAYTGLAAGSHTFQVRAIDGAGNVDPSPASFTWTIDLTAPDTTLTAMPAGREQQRQRQLLLLRLGGRGLRVQARQRHVRRVYQPPGLHRARRRQPHLPGPRHRRRRQRRSLPRELHLDHRLTAPDTTLTAMPATISASANASFSFSATETGAFACQLDGGGFASCTSPQAYTGLSAGSHTFQVRATDGAGNVDPSPASFTWTIDLTAPDTTLTAMPATISASANASFSFSATETGAFDCQLDGGGFASCTSPQAYSGLGAGSHTFQVRALDGAGNVDPSPASFTWTVDLTAPDTTLTAMPATVSASANASFSFSASEAAAPSSASSTAARSARAPAPRPTRGSPPAATPSRSAPSTAPATSTLPPRASPGPLISRPPTPPSPPCPRS